MVLGVDITGEFLRIILTVKIDIEASILFFIRIKRNSNMGVAATNFKNLYGAQIVNPYNYFKKALNRRSIEL